MCDVKGIVFCHPQPVLFAFLTEVALNDEMAPTLQEDADVLGGVIPGELKTDMDLERLPSGKFETNELVLELAILSYNILRMIGQESLGKRNPHLNRMKLSGKKHRRHASFSCSNACCFIKIASIHKPHSYRSADGRYPVVIRFRVQNIHRHNTHAGQKTGTKPQKS